MEWNHIFTNSNTPTWKQVADYINSSLWTEFNNQIQTAYQIEPNMAYSSCSMQPGWNIKYKKSGKALCTLYPMSGYFIALVVIGEQEMAEVECLMPFCSNYVQDLFQSTKTGNGQKWLMIEVRNQEILEDVLKLISLRKRPKINKLA